jgi:hypothetical protein
MEHLPDANLGLPMPASQVGAVKAGETSEPPRSAFQRLRYLAKRGGGQKGGGYLVICNATSGLVFPLVATTSRGMEILRVVK